MKSREQFDQEILKTGQLHWRMEADREDSLESSLLNKPVDLDLSLWDGHSSVFSQKGEGTLRILPEGCLSMETTSRADRWPEGSPSDGDYCTFGSLQAVLPAKDADWRPYNRLRFRIYPDCPGMHSPMIALQLYNDGEEKIPDKYCREGYHTIHLKNREWNDCVWEFPSLPRDRVTALAFEAHRYGKEVSMGDFTRFLIRDIRLEHTAQENHTLGWQTDPGAVAYSTEGYWAKGRKTAVTCEQTAGFSLCRVSDGQPVYTGSPRPVVNEKGRFFLWDFSDFSTEGEYFLQGVSLPDPPGCGRVLKTAPFSISSHPLYQTVWKEVHFLYCERCGFPVGRGHGSCHGDILAEHNGVKLAYCGGWHDAGDVSQQTLQTAEVVWSLLEMAKAVQHQEPSLYFRILEEAAWGLDFVLRMRFGDGYRATSAGIRRWSDGLIGNLDDCRARVHNHAFENFLMSGIEAFASDAFCRMDPQLAEKCRTAAREDFLFARERFEQKGMELPSFYEHSYNSSLSLYHAAAGWAASRIYAAAGDAEFAGFAAEHIDSMLACQETGDLNCPMSGFFYREPDHKSIVHFNHQSREHLFALALDAACETQPEHPRFSFWKDAMARYADYLKQTARYAQPYGMLPAGIHKMDEYLDKKTFPLLHLMTSFEEDSPNYRKQLEQGVRLDENYCLRQFPVWFSFRGNGAVHLSAGKAAAILGRALKDEELMQVAREQIYWTFGKNPFCQSLVYGAGRNFAQQYGALNGEMVGSIPVGVETRGNGDVPFWPMENNATYKEVWTTCAARWLSLAAEVY